MRKIILLDLVAFKFRTNSNNNKKKKKRRKRSSLWKMGDWFTNMSNSSNRIMKMNSRVMKIKIKKMIIT